MKKVMPILAALPVKLAAIPAELILSSMRFPLLTLSAPPSFAKSCKCAKLSAPGIDNRGGIVYTMAV